MLWEQFLWGEFSERLGAGTLGQETHRANTLAGMPVFTAADIATIAGLFVFGLFVLGATEFGMEKKFSGLG